MDIKGEKAFFGNPDWDPATSMTLVSRFCHMSSVRSTSDGRGPVTRKRVVDDTVTVHKYYRIQNTSNKRAPASSAVVKTAAMIQGVATCATVLALQGVPTTPSAWLANRDPSPIDLMAPWLPTYATSSMTMTKILTGFSRRLVESPRFKPTGTTLMWSSRCTRLLSVTCLPPLKSVPRQALPTRSLTGEYRAQTGIWR